MDDAKLGKLLEELQIQSYPLQVTEEQAIALTYCIQAIMEEVPEDNKVLVRGHYSLATSALHHPDAPDNINGPLG